MSSPGTGTRRATTRRFSSTPTTTTSLASGLWPPGFGLGACLLGFFLAAEGWRAAAVQHLRLTAARLRREPDGRDRQIACLEAGARLAPEYARLQVELGQAHLNA